MKLSKTDRREKRNTDIIDQFSQTGTNRSKLAHTLANKYDITIARVYQILEENKVSK